MIRKYGILLIVFFLTASFMPTPHESEKYPKALIVRMVSIVGDINKLKSLNDVEYKLTCSDRSTGNVEVSVERYVFEGELSVGEYDIHEISVFPDQGGKVVQGFNGEESWVTLDGKLVDDAEARKIADVMRKKNLYWFSMMPKLLDSGVKYHYAGMRNVDNKGYNIVEITFDDNVGETSDKFVLYINSKTHLVDQLLFTMKVFDREEPMLMKLEYEEVSGVKLPVKRRYTKSNWNGEILDDNWTEEIMTDIKFNNGLDKSDFNKPS